MNILPHQTNGGIISAQYPASDGYNQILTRLIRKIGGYLFNREEMPNFAEQIMNIQNPYQGVEHKVFKRTFLQNTEVGVEFEPSMTTEEFSMRIVPFVNNVFNQNIEAALDKATERAELNSSDNQVRFDFTLNSAKVIIGQSVYKSFSSSALQFIQTLIRFIKEVTNASAISRVYIKKTNDWPIESKNSKLSLKGASFFIFKKEHIDDIANIKFEESDYPVSAAKEAVVKCGDSASLRAVIRVELDNPNHTNFILGLEAQASEVGIDDVLPALSQLNDIVFCAFTDIVSDNIFDLMSKDAL